MSREAELAQIKDSLEEERIALEKQIDEQTGEADGDAVNPDRADLAQSYDDWQRRSALVNRKEQKLRQVEAALERLEKGTYGKCATCGENIAKARLDALPHAELCIRCREKGQGRSDSSFAASARS